MSSIIKVDNIQDQCGSAVVTKCGSTVTLGASGDTIQLACGASQTGFGRTGTVNWDTTAKTASFTAVSGNGYFVNTTSGAITVTLPTTPSAGDIISIADYAGTAGTNNITVARNGSNINGDASDLTISNNNSAITLVYVDGTQGWKGTETSNLNDIALQPEYIVASGGTITTCGDYKIHTFTGPGTFTVTCAGNVAGSNLVDYMVVAGGGGGAGWSSGSGGGAGGFRESSGAASGCYTASPLGACVSALPVSVTSYPITVGGGGPGGPGSPPGVGTAGSNSTFSTITSAGGGFGGTFPGPNGGAGGSGGGGSNNNCSGAGNTPPVSPPQGTAGGGGQSGCAGGGGGGATVAGLNGTPPNQGGAGGAGASTQITTSPSYGEATPTPARAFAGGGGGRGGAPATPQPGGLGGGGDGGTGNTGNTAGTTNTGGGGGGNGSAGTGAAGGSGIVIIRYKYQ